MVKTFFPILFCLVFIFPTQAQDTSEDEDAFFIRKIYDTALTEAKCYTWLHFLTTEIGGRIAGSPQLAAAVEYTRQELKSLQVDSVWLQECMVPHWVRGAKEQVRIVNSSSFGTLDLGGLALGNCIATGAEGVTAEVIEVQSLDELETLGKEKIEGRIVFFNRPMNPRQIRTFNAYGGAVDQRVYGAARAARFGAVAALVRSMTTRLDDIPHTGVMVYEEGTPKIPGVAISTNDAELLSRLLKKESVRVHLETYCQTLPDKLSHNVIAEIKGSEFPDEIILVGGHLDSWDVGDGAHDDGSGCVQSMEVIHLLKTLNYRPKRTIRCVMFTNEENGLRGALKYAEESNQKKEFHLAAIESDAGGFTPRGFACDGDAAIFTPKFQSIVPRFSLLEPYGLILQKGGGGADISPLKSQQGLLFGLRPDSQRYFDYHHTEIDRIDAVNQRELELGAAAMCSLVFLIDKYGL